MENEVLLKAVRLFDSQERLSKALGVNRRVVNNWLNKSIRMPVQYALSIEMLTDGKILAEELSPHAKLHIVQYKKYLLVKEYGNERVF